MNHYRTAMALAAGLAVQGVHAFDIETSDLDAKMRFDLTAKYSLGYRLKNASDDVIGLAADGGRANENDGDNNFRKGLTSNRVDLLGEFDYSNRWGGFRLSGTGFYDDVYRRGNDNDAANVVNRYAGAPADQFTGFTRRQHGQDAQLLDAFVLLKNDFGEGMSGSLRLGKHTLQYGESLFFGQNGIANAQGPVDVAKILSVPGWQFKEVLLPVEQVSTSIQLRQGLSVGAYYQFKWRPSRIPGAGSYFSNNEYLNTETSYVDLTGAPMPPSIARFHVLQHDPAYDVKPKNNGQGGVQLRWAPGSGEYELGFYAARFHDKTPAIPLFDLVNDRVNTVYGQGTNTFGASITGSNGQLNWAVEGSIRTNATLNGDIAFTAGGVCGNTGANKCYAVGKTAHVNVSGIYVLQPSLLWQGGAWLTELAWNRTLSVTSGSAPSVVAGGGVDPNTTRDAYALRTLFTPTYFQVLPQVDLNVPISLGYNFKGRSSAVAMFNGGTSNAGDLSVGLQGVYNHVWIGQINYTRYLGKAGSFTEAISGGRQLSFNQSLKDRDYLSVSVQHTF